MSATSCDRDAAALRLVEGFSMEMTGRDVAGLQEAAPVIPGGTRMNITFLASEDLETRVRAAAAVTAAGLLPVPHIAARRLRSRQELEQFLDRLSAVGASERVFVVGGDPSAPEGPYPSALSVVRTGLLTRYGVREVSLAGYPEGHPDIGDDVLRRHLRDKLAAVSEQGLRGEILTQFAFDTRPVLRWVSELRGDGVVAPVRVGTPGPAGIKRLLGFARRFGISAEAMIVKKYGFSLTNLMGTAGPDRFVTELSSQLADRSRNDGGGLGAVKLHFYTFGGLLATAQWASDYAARRSAA